MITRKRNEHNMYINGNYAQIEIEELRDIILGKFQFRRCPRCDNEGRTWGTENGIEIPPQEANPNIHTWEPCESCSGLAYIPIPEE
jgi:uncharacterized protein with PIN domain